MRRILNVTLGLLVMRVSLVAQHGPLPPPTISTPAAISIAAQSGVRLALVQQLDAPVLLESIAHEDDRLAGSVRLRNTTSRTVSAVALAFTLGVEPLARTPAFRRVALVPVTLGGGQTMTVDVPGLTVQTASSLLAAAAPVVEVAIVGVQFTTGAPWRAAGGSSWLGRPDVRSPLVCVDAAGQTQVVDPLTAITAGATVCQGGGL